MQNERCEWLHEVCLQAEIMQPKLCPYIYELHVRYRARLIHPKKVSLSFEFLRKTGGFLYLISRLLFFKTFSMILCVQCAYLLYDLLELPLCLSVIIEQPETVHSQSNVSYEHTNYTNSITKFWIWWSWRATSNIIPYACSHSTRPYCHKFFHNNQEEISVQYIFCSFTK